MTEMYRSYFEKSFPKWDVLTKEEQQQLLSNAVEMTYEKGSILHHGSQECKGLMFVQTGQLRAFIMSPEGREITLFRIQQEEMCILSASCLMDAIAFDVMIDAIEDTTVLLLPSQIVSGMIKKHMEIELYLYKESAERFSDVIWMLQQILFLGVDQRIANFLWDEITTSGNDTIAMTQDEIARLIGSAREVVSKVLKYFSQEGIAHISRGKIMVLDKEKLKKYIEND